MSDTPVATKPVAILVYDHTCLRCGYAWRSANARPRQCRGCNSRRWDRPKIEAPLGSKEGVRSGADRVMMLNQAIKMLCKLDEKA